MKKLTGVGVALVTPFDATGAIDYRSLKKLLTHTARGVDYFVVMGTTGEAATLSREEKREVLKFVRSNNPKKLPIVFGIGGYNTHEVLEDIHRADLDGVEAILSVSPYYSKPPQEGIYRHFCAVADASPVPVILYNVPARTSSNITAETTLRLATHGNIIGIKEASGSIEQCMRIARMKPKDFLLISGDDMITVAMYAIGGAGVISVLANAYPQIFKKMNAFAGSSNYRRSSNELFKLLDINGPMYEEGNPVGVKAVLEEMGICSSAVRLPLAEATEGLKTRIRTLMQKV